MAFDRFRYTGTIENRVRQANKLLVDFGREVRRIRERIIFIFSSS